MGLLCPVFWFPTEKAEKALLEAVGVVLAADWTERN